MTTRLSDFYNSPPYIQRVSYQIEGLGNWRDNLKRRGRLIRLDAPYQRDNVWDIDQRISYVEYILSGGINGLNIYVNLDPSYRDPDIWVIDGKQRLESLFQFVDGVLPVFGKTLSEWGGIREVNTNIEIFIHRLNLSLKEQAKFYVKLNSTGVAHTPSELDKAHKIAGL